MVGVGSEGGTKPSKEGRAVEVVSEISSSLPFSIFWIPNQAEDFDSALDRFWRPQK